MSQHEYRPLPLVALSILSVLTVLTISGCGGSSSPPPPPPPPSKQLTVSPATMSFGNVTMGTSRSQTGSLTAGSSDITVSSASWNGAGYSLSGITFPSTVSAGQSLPFTVTFDPQAAGNSAGMVAFVSNATNSPTQEMLSGAGLQPPHTVTLSWTASVSTVAGYNIYRSTQSGGPYTQLNSSVQPGTTFADGSVLSGTTYFYVVTAVDSSFTESPFSNETMAVVPTP